MSHSGEQPTQPMTPTVHLNGTSKNTLVENLLAAFKAGEVFQDALVEARPNARDYYVAGPEAFPKAVAEHNARLVKVAEMLRDLQAIALAVQQQGRSP
jgi:hypothetical protein